jgi:hypothetical protein
MIIIKPFKKKLIYKITLIWIQTQTQAYTQVKS